jgi:hypothetical protein
VSARDSTNRRRLAALSGSNSVSVDDDVRGVVNA